MSASASTANLQTVSVALSERSYEIHIQPGCLANLASIIEPWNVRFGQGKTSRTGVIVSDSNVRSHAETARQSLVAAGWRIELIELPPGEPTKNLAVISSIYDRLVDLPADRRTVVFAVGGGVIGDAAGFAAASYNRGMPFIQCPTTLLSDVDSSVGGKVGVNHPKAKNLIGAFHQPLGVVIDTEVLRTLPDREYRAGLAEVVKYGVILDAEFFSWLEDNQAALNTRDPQALLWAITRSCRLKADVVEHDEYERTGLRAVLNYGHTFGHAFEALAGYGELLHGEGVSIGMVYASRLAVALGRIPEAMTQRQVALLSGLGLPTVLPARCQWPTEEILGRMRLDKKSEAGLLRFVLPTRMGHVELVDGVDEALVRRVLES
ncbi:MAG: 3-dehydroquinate synthase [Planctomycetota bacterium]|nr:MAG: 3-dehydroquinate synthase [Planctomycetota bacterium]